MRDNNKKSLEKAVKIIVGLLVFCICVILALLKFPLNRDGGDIDSETSAFSQLKETSYSSGFFSDDSQILESSGEEEPALPALSFGAEVNLLSKHIIVYDIDKNYVLYERGAESLCYPASLSKLMTALVALEHLPPETLLTVGSEVLMIGENSSTAYLTAGQRLPAEALTDALLLPSGNDAAYVFAVNAAKKALGDEGLSNADAVRAFVGLMNEKARELGCQNTVFVTPDGYDADGQKTTAADMARISAAAYKNDTIRASVGKTEREYKFEGGGKSLWKNTNALIRPESSFYSDCATGMKTGSTDLAGYCLAVSAEIKGGKYIIVLMDCVTPADRNRDALEIIKGIQEIAE